MLAWLASFYRIFHYLSFDVALGACAGMYFFARLFDVRLSGVAYLTLVMAVWVIYTFDHLLDARFSPGELVSPRHLFHRIHFKILVFMAIFATFTVLILAWTFLPSTAIFLTGALLAGIILSYMLLSQCFKNQIGPFKEIVIALLYVAGLLLLPLMQGLENITSWRWLHYVGAYLLLAWFNLVFLSLLDRDPDRLAGQRSLVSALGIEKTRQLLYWLGLTGLLYIVSLFFLLPSAFHIFTIIVLILFTWHMRYFLEGRAPSEEIRSKLELAFFLPAVLILMS
jgi:4-hydroxybenzoate polyprenyltransferase